MTMQTYELMTLNAQEMLRFNEIVKDVKNGNYTIRYCYNLADRTIRNAIVKSVDLYDESALTYQIGKALGEGCDLTRCLIYVDFHNLFSSKSNKKKDAKQDDPNAEKATPSKEGLQRISADKKMRILFRDGVTLKFADGVETTYVPFDKSASMARDNRITFIAQDLKTVMDQRLMLDIPHCKIKTNLSKLYAYRGLYLTAARRLALNTEFVMNSETVIVVKDKKTLVDNQLLLTAKACEDDEDVWSLTDPEIGTVCINAFDGEGLISTEYALKINEQLASAYGFTQRATSFQIRMPFAKGVLHEVNFHEFVKEFSASGSDDVIVMDIFNRPRSLKKAQIIFTESMFKCCKWLAAFIGEGDPMKYYFEKFKKYDHSLYVGNTDVNLSYTGRVKLNYQFLNTLAIAGSDFDALIEQQKYALSLAKNNCLRIKDITSSQADERDSDADEATSDPAWALALSKNKAFLHDPKITGMVSGIENGMLKDCGLGRIDVEGECRFISRDLLSMLIHILECCVDDNAIQLAKLEESKIKCLRLDKFYLPSPAIKLDPQNNYGLLRNPHLSRNEQAVLKPYIPKKEESNLYDKYFSHLRGVVMVAYRSLVPMTLSGCDFDGDLVKIVSEPIIVKAIVDSVYSKNGQQRRLPTIDIPSIGSTDAVAPDAVDYETVKNTFSNSVGYISNLAIKFGKEEYTRGEDSGKYAGKCAECTIVTGLEIDAAKTGRHPNLELLEALDTHEKDYFLQVKEQIANLSLKRGVVFSTVSKGDVKEILVSYKKANQPYLRVREIPADFDGANIDRLPYWFVKLLQEKLEKPARSTRNKTAKSRPTYYTFQTEASWRDNLDQNKLDALSDIIGSYNKLMRLASSVYRAKEKYKDSKYAACIYNLLMIKYDGMDAEILPGMTVKETLEKAYLLLDSVLDSEDKAKSAIGAIVEGEWQFIEKAKRKSFIAKVFGIEETEITPELELLLCDFNCSGYKLLYYITKDVFCQNGEIFAQKLVDDDVLLVECGIDPALYAEMLNMYREAIKNKESKKVWERKLIRICRTEVSKLFNKDFDEALLYAHKLRSAVDKSGSFFWSVFRSDEILRNVYSAPEIGGEANVK